MPKITMDGKYMLRYGGNPVRIYAIDGGDEYPVHGAVRMSDSSWSPDHWTANGHKLSDEIEHYDDIIEVPEMTHSTLPHLQNQGVERCGRKCNPFHTLKRIAAATSLSKIRALAKSIPHFHTCKKRHFQGVEGVEAHKQPTKSAKIAKNEKS